MALLTKACRMLVARQSQVIAKRMKSGAAAEPYPPRHHWLALITFPIPVWIVMVLPTIIAERQMAAEGHHEKKH